MPLANARRAKPSKSSRSGSPDVIRKPPFAVLIQNSTDLETSKRVTDRSPWYEHVEDRLRDHVNGIANKWWESMRPRK
ncbi:hypothetical protein GUK36_36625 [Rhizobium leguminosarum]|uniref:Uncharacterized protein n=1 Tax=Rhizobium leguminosarum TaxID=384 RepID=A0A6P0DNQ8_RHILE|nr:hypothetical protein [Rhizobium leguminosarum]